MARTEGGVFGYLISSMTLSDASELYFCKRVAVYFCKHEKKTVSKVSASTTSTTSTIAQNLIK